MIVFTGGGKRFQQVYVADVSDNMLCLNFWNDVKEMAVEEIIKEGTILLIKNVQWRTFDKIGHIQTGYITDYTIFLTRASIPEFKEFETAVGLMNKKNYLQECLSQIEVGIFFI